MDVAAGEQVALLGAMVAGRVPVAPAANAGSEGDGKVRKLAARLTKKQHAVLQMLSRSASNSEIARRLHLDENTVIGLVHTIMGHIREELGEAIYSRVQVAELGGRMMEALTEVEYQRIALIPKDWDQTWTLADEEKHRHLYIPRTGH